MALESANPRFQHTYGCVLLWLDRSEEALLHLRKADELAPDAADPDGVAGCPLSAIPASRAVGVEP